MPHGGANGLVPLLPAGLCEPDKAIRIALGERHAETCAMERTLSGGFWTLSLDPPLGVEVISEFQEFQEFKTTQSIFKR